MIRVGVSFTIRDREENTSVFVGVQLLHVLIYKVNDTYLFGTEEQ